jgi:hypothetical protein
MALKLDSPREIYKEFSGKATGHPRNIDQMPALIAEGRVPMNVSQLMQRRLDYRNGPAEVKIAWMDNYFDTGDAVIYHHTGEVKIVLDSQTLREMTPKNQRNGGALILDPDVYKALQGEVVKKGKLEKISGWMSKADIKTHPILKVLARDQALLNDYTDLIFVEHERRFGDDNTKNFSLGSCGRDKPEMRAFRIGGLGCFFASGKNYLNNENGRLVGIASEALDAPGRGASNVRAYSMEDVQTARKQLDDLTQVKPELLVNIRSLLKKL